MKYIRDGLKDEYGILELQDKILGIMVYLDSFCEKYGIDYCLMAGSALGARRHQGFIPWDDDIDIYMTEQGYAKFRNKFLKYGDHGKYYLQEWGKTNWHGKHMVTMAKIRMNGTEIKEKALQGWKIHQGIFVDIFILHNCADDRKLQRKQYVWSEAVVLRGLEVRGYKAKNVKEKAMLFCSRLLPRKWLMQCGLYNTYKYQNKKTSFVHVVIYTRKFSHAVFPANIMFPAKYTEFETVRLKIPADNDEYLKIQFGEDYMTVPPENKRQVNKHALGWSENADITYDDLSDEKKLI